MKSLMDKIRHGIDTHGLMIMAIADKPAFSYTIGMTETLGIPEAVVVGLSPELSHGVLMSFYGRLEKDRGLSLADGMFVNQVITNFPVKIRALEHEHTQNILKLTSVGGGDIVKPIQILIPDREGRFPGDPGCDPEYERMQDISRLLSNALERDQNEGPASPGGPMH